MWKKKKRLNDEIDRVKKEDRFENGKRDAEEVMFGARPVGKLLG